MMKGDEALLGSGEMWGLNIGIIGDNLLILWNIGIMEQWSIGRMGKELMGC